MSRHPEVKWAQRVEKVYLTILLADAKNVQINLEPDGVFTFSGLAGSDNALYELKLELLGKANVEASKLNSGVRSIFCVIEKVEKVWWNKLLRGDGKPPHYIKVDWDKWVDEDEDTGKGDDNFGGMDFSKFGGMDGGDDDYESDDEAEVDAAMPEEPGKDEKTDEAGKAEKTDEALATKREAESSAST